MSRKKFDEFYKFNGSIDDLIKKISSIDITGWSGTRSLSIGGFFFGIHDRDGARNKRLAIVFEKKETCEKIYDQIRGLK